MLTTNAANHFKIRGPYVVTYLYWTPNIVWYIITRLVARAGHQRNMWHFGINFDPKFGSSFRWCFIISIKKGTNWVIICVFFSTFLEYKNWHQSLYACIRMPLNVLIQTYIHSSKTTISSKLYDFMEKFCVDSIHDKWTRHFISTFTFWQYVCVRNIYKMGLNWIMPAYLPYCKSWVLCIMHHEVIPCSSKNVIGCWTCPRATLVYIKKNM